MKEDEFDLQLGVIEIADIIVKERLRKDVRNIDDLAEDILKNGLISPIFVMKTAEGIQLVAGLRRLRALERLGIKEIPALMWLAGNAVSALKIEFAENEKRESFTFSEKMDFALLFEDAVKAEALKRKTTGAKVETDGLEGTHHTNGGTGGVKGEARDILGAMIGMSGVQYDRAKYVRQNAAPEVLDEIDAGKRSISGVYNELKANEKAKKSKAEADKTDASTETESVTEANLNVAELPSEPPKKLTRAEKLREKQLAVLPPKDRAMALQLEAFAKMTDKEKVVDLQRQLHEQRARAAEAETGWTREKELHYNNKLHMSGTIENQGKRLESLWSGYKQLEAEVCQLNAENAELKTENSQLADENATLRTELAELKKGLQNNQ